MDSTDSRLTDLPVDGLLVNLVNTLAAGSKHPLQSLVAIHSASALAGSVFRVGVPESWQHQDVAPEAMAAITRKLLNEGSVVLIVPPWGRRPSEASENEGKNLSGGTRASTLLRPPEMQEEILLGCSAPDSDAKLFVLLPASALRNERSRPFRAALMAEWGVTDVIVMQGVIAGIHSAFECVLLGLRPAAHADQTTRFFNAGHPKDTDASKVIADFARLQRMKGGQTELGYVFRGGIEEGESLDYSLRDPKLDAKRNDLAHFGRTVALEDLFEVRRTVQRDTVTFSSHSEGAARVVSGRDIVRGALADESGEAQWAAADPRHLLRPGDFLTPAITRGSDRGGFKVVAHAADDGPTIAGPNVLVLRPRDSVPTEIIDFAVAYLRSPVARRLHFGANRNVVLGRDFDQLAVPVPDDEILTALRNLRDAQRNFLEWADEAAAVIDSIFEYPSVREARPRIIEAGRRVRWRSREARSLDDPDFAVRRAFPYPIAHRWRVMEAALSGASTPGVGYASILDAAETLLAFLAQVTFVLAQTANIEVKAKQAIRSKLRGGSGPSMGDWASVLQETTAKHFGEAQGALVEISGMFRLQEVEAARVRLSGRRNDEAHNRRVEAVDMKAETEAALADLRTLTKAADFLVDMPLRHVTDTSWDSFARRATVTFREMVGDHWVVKSQTTLVPTNEIESNSLYVVDPEGHWHLLRPYLVVRDCPQCRTLSTFHVDAVKSGEVRLKSLENGHTILDSRDLETLASVGIY